MSTKPKLHDVIALLADLPEVKLTRGQVGTVVDVQSPTNLLVEFSDDEGKVFAITPVTTTDALVLQYEREVA